MNRLDAMILRMMSQRAALDWCADQLADRPGDLLEIGLGNGRTYDHLREKLPDRRIWAIDRKLQPHPSCLPPEEDRLIGDAGDELAKLAGAALAFANYDLGSGKVNGNPHEPDDRATRLTPLLTDALADGALVASTQRLADHPQLALHPITAEIGQNRVYIYEKRG